MYFLLTRVCRAGALAGDTAEEAAVAAAEASLRGALRSRLRAAGVATVAELLPPGVVAAAAAGAALACARLARSN